MSGFLLDTNVVSETVKPVPEPRVVSFLSGELDLWLSTVVLHEMDYGLNLLPPGRRRDRLSTALASFVAHYEDRILAVGRQEAQQAARLRVQAHRLGRVLHLADALIAGTANANKLSVVTRNVDDFQDLDVSIVNPWNTR